MAIIPGVSGSYRASNRHIGEDRLQWTLEIINEKIISKKSKKNTIITEGLELRAIKEKGTIEEKLKAMNISYMEIMAYMNKIEAVRYKSVAPKELNELRHNMNKAAIQNNDGERTIVDEEYDDKVDDVTVDAAEMINSMYRD